MKIIYKTLMMSTSNQYFSIKYLRNLRWWAYKRYFNSPRIYISDNVKIVEAHRNNESGFISGKEVHIGANTYIDYSGGITIGNYLAISQEVSIFTHNHSVHGEYKDWNRNSINFSKLVIEDYSWIGSHVIVLESVARIAEGSIVAAGSVLTKDTEAYGIYAGNPARKIGSRVVNEK